MDGTAFGRYRLLGLLGSGGMGQVFRAYDTATDRVVALKVLARDLANDLKFRERFRREAHAAARLSEPHVVPIHDYGEIDGRLFLDMRLVDGRDLAAVLASGPIAKDVAVEHIRQIGSALDAAHRAGLVHRDVKPANILVAAGDFVYLIDFGIAVGAGDAGLTTTGAAIGSFAYIAPERLAHGTCDARSDVYSLTCVLYECLTGTQPFPGSTVEQQITAHLNTPPPRPSAAAAALSPFDRVIARGMAKDPRDRYHTAGDLAEAARAALATEPASPAAPVPESRRPDTRRTAAAAPPRTLPGSVGILVLIATAVVVWWVISDHAQHNSPTTPAPVTCVTADPAAARDSGLPTAPALGSPSGSCAR